MKNKVNKFLGKMAENNMAFRGTLEELAYVMGFEDNDIKVAVLELIEKNEISYIIDEDIYTLTIKGE
jgi:hypothetical protein